MVRNSQFFSQHNIVIGRRDENEKRKNERAAAALTINSTRRA